MNDGRGRPLVRVAYGSTLHRTVQAVFALAGFALLFAIPFVTDTFRLRQLTQSLGFAVAVLGLSIALTGGLLSLAHGAFVGLGAYTTAVLVGTHGWPWLGGAAAACLAGFVAGVITGLPGLRLRGTALATASLGLAVIFPTLVRSFDTITGGANGLRVRSDIVPPGWTGLSPGDRQQWVFVLAALIALVMFWGAHNLFTSRTGRALNAIREGELAAAASGVPVGRLRVFTFGLSAAFGAVGGAILVIDTPFVSPDSYTALMSISLLTAVLVGGVGTLAGALIGGLFVVFVPAFAADVGGPDSILLAPGVVYALVLIGTMFFAPGGLVGALRVLRARVVRVDRSPPVLGPRPPDCQPSHLEQVPAPVDHQEDPVP
jgi:branched-chain amino acid transport system permease protein